MYLQNKTCVFIYRKQEDFMGDWKYQWEDTVITGLTSSNRSDVGYHILGYFTGCKFLIF